METLIQETAVCSKCKQPKPISEFYFRKDSGKRRPQCKPCHYRPDAKKLWDYKLTPEKLKQILDGQDGHCAICPETEGLEVDHDHECCPKRPTCGNCVRGLLCDSHNRGVGFFTKEELSKIVEYLGGKISWVRN